MEIDSFRKLLFWKQIVRSTILLADNKTIPKLCEFDENNAFNLILRLGLCHDRHFMSLQLTLVKSRKIFGMEQ